METVKIVFDIDTSDVKTSTQDLVALNKATESEIETLKKLEAESNANKVAFSQLSKELKSANTELINAKKQFGDTSKEAQSAQKNVDALTDKMAELKNQVKPLDDAFVSLRTQVKLAKEEAVKAAEKYGEFSKEANAARVKAGALADQMGDLNRQVGLLNPEAKAKAFSNLAQGVVGAFSIATGAVQAFGIKNKEVEQAAQKLQAALNITQGIASLGQLKEAYQDVKVVLGFTTVAQEAMTVATEAEAVASTQAAVATKGFTAALLTNPIFLAVAAIAALAGAMIAMSDDTEEAESKIKLMTESQKALRQATNDAADAADRLALAQGKLSSLQAQINKTYRDNAADVQDVNEKLKENNLAIEKNNKVIREVNKAYAEAQDRNARRRADLREEVVFQNYVNDEYVEAVKKNKELDQANKDLTKSIKIKNEAVKTTVDALKAEDAAQQAEKKKQDAKEAASQAKQNAKEREAQAKEELRLADALRKKLQENALAEISDPNERIKMARKFADENYAIELERLQNAKASQDEIDLLAAGHTDLINKLNTEEVNSNKSKNDKLLAAEKKYQDALLALALAEETDPIKRAQIINDAKEKEIDNQIALAEKGSKEEAALLADKQRLEIEAQKRIEGAQKEVKAQDDKNKQEQTKSDEQAAKDKIATAQFAFNAISELSNSLAALQKAQTDQEIANLQAQYDKKLITEKQYNLKLKELKRKQWEADKRARIIEATMGIANGIINALSIRPTELVPYAIGLAGTVGALNLATIIAQKPPQFAKGTLSVPGIDMGRDSVHAILQPGEAVIPTKTNKAYHPTIKAIYEKKISPSEINNFVMSRTSSGGKQSVTANVDTYALSRVLGKNKAVEVSNAGMIGRAMAKELLRGQNLRRS
jgi:hypothetical protein